MNVHRKPESTPDLGAGRSPNGKRGSWIPLKRGIAFSVSGTLGALILTSALPPLLADQSDRAVVNAPVTLLTAPISGEVRTLATQPGQKLATNAKIAEIVNDRVDRSTLITLESKQAETQENLRAIKAKRQSNALYIGTLADEIAKQSAIVVAQYQKQIVQLTADVGAATAAAEEKKGVLGHQSSMVARNVAAPEMAKAATQQFAAAGFQTQSAAAKLSEKQAQLDSARRGIFVGDDVHDLAALIQKRRDMEFDVQRLIIEEAQVAAAVQNQAKLLDAERKRLAILADSTVNAPGSGEVLYVGASVGRHVSAGDTIARMVDCDTSFVVAIFSYRSGSDLAPGARVTIDAGPAGTREGTVTEVLPKTSDKVDETYAVPFPQTERRELYVLVKPDTPLRHVVADGTGEQCDIGRWVTITRSSGWLPSTSVLWREAGQALIGGARAAVSAPSTVSESGADAADGPVTGRTADRRS